MSLQYSSALPEVIAKGKQVKCTVTLKKLRISLGLNVVGNIWDYVLTQLNKLYNNPTSYFKAEQTLHNATTNFLCKDNFCLGWS